MLASRITTPNPTNPEIEDIFSSSLSILFTDDTQQSHGVPGQSVIYRSPRFGDVTLRIPAHPDEESGRTLFAHYLWNAGVVAAEAVERASCKRGNWAEGDADGDGDVNGENEGGTGEWEGMWKSVEWDRRYWDVRGRDVLELGAGTALPSLISALSSASSITITDHPSSPALTTNAIAANVKLNITEGNDRNITDTTTAVRIAGYAWGTQDFQFHPITISSLAHDAFPSSPPTQTPIPPQPSQPALHSFDKIIIADCLWMASQHGNLVKTITDYLRPAKVQQTPSESNQVDGQSTQTESIPCALVLAGFHTGRKIVADFIELATGSAYGFDGVDDNDGPSDENVNDVDDRRCINGSQSIQTLSSPSPSTSTSATLSATTTKSNEQEQEQEQQDQNQNNNNHISNNNSSNSNTNHHQKGQESPPKNKENHNNNNNNNEDENKNIKGEKLKASLLYEINIHGHTRPWQPIRQDEDKEERKKWVVCCILTLRW